MNTSVSIERWAPILDWPGYQISTHGRVRGRRSELRMFLVGGYPAFNVSNGIRRKSLRVHREVLRAFVGDRPGYIVRHLDGNPRNCRIENLAWGSFADNEADKSRHGRDLRGERHHQAKLTDAQVREIKGSQERGTELARRFGVTPTMVCAIRKGRAWRHL